MAHAETNFAIKPNTSNSDAAFGPLSRMLQRTCASSGFAALRWIYGEFCR
jgi:hypothetical protein